VPEARVLAVDDEADMLEVLEDVLRRPGLAVETERDSGRALLRLGEETFDLLITDLRMPGMDGLALLQAAREADPDLLVLVVTAYPAVESAVEAIRGGAFDYVTKPFEPDHLRIVVDRALSHRRLAWENRFLRRQLAGQAAYQGMIGRSASMRQVFELVETIAPKDANVFVVGESGTGKDLVAHAIHDRSARSGGNFVPVDCGALPEALLESELFGHERGAFTGAVKTNPGLFEFADGGTVFLDEICELPLPLQAKLLRALQERQVRRVGGREMRRADVRVVSATNRDIEQEVLAKRFRQDLYYRLNVVMVRLPPLRERSEDIPVLVAHFLEQFGCQAEREVRGIAPETLGLLVRYPWPGNVRELRNVVERGVSLTNNEFLLPSDLPEALRESRGKGSAFPLGAFSQARAERVAAFEREYLTALLLRTRGNVSQAARLGGIPRGSLHRLMRRHNLRSDEFSR
jgi:two-component system response regulator AtoC